MPSPDASAEIASGERFAFGENWNRFLSVLDEERIDEACRSLSEMLGVPSLSGSTFLDVGSGSGLFSLAALRLGADRVHSVDFDPASVACGRELRTRYYPDDGRWAIEQGDALDAEGLRALGRFDVVYSWGVLHHTGDMWRAIANVCEVPRPDGTLFLAIYDDQGTASRRWRAVKKLYNQLPRTLRPPFVALVMLPFEVRSLVKQTLLGRPWRYFRSFREYRKARGMSRWHDMVDWVGGYPFEVATVEELTAFVVERGYESVAVRPTRGHGCNEYVFRRSTSN